MTKTLGIDIGKSTIHVAVSSGASPPKLWEVTELHFDQVDWDLQLRHLAEGCQAVALEPTGWHYSRPVVAVLEAAGFLVLRVAHQATKATREDRISSQKTDPNDARALALKALDWCNGQQTLGVKQHNPHLEDLNITLRLTLSRHRHFAKRATQALNRLDGLAFSMWPSLAASKNTWLRAVGAGYVTPQELIGLSEMMDDIQHYPEGYSHGNTRNALHRLASTLPDVAVPSILRSAVLYAYQEHVEADAQRQAVELELEQLVWCDELAPVSEVWSSVPGAYTLAIAALHAAGNCEAENFTTASFRAAVGCHPSRQESGQVTETQEAKRGYRLAKKHLHLWTLLLLRDGFRPNPIADYFDRLKEAGRPFAIHSTRGKLARILSHLARSGEDCNWEEPHA